MRGQTLRGSHRLQAIVAQRHSRRNATPFCILSTLDPASTWKCNLRLGRTSSKRCCWNAKAWSWTGESSLSGSGYGGLVCGFLTKGLGSGLVDSPELWNDGDQETLGTVSSLVLCALLSSDPNSTREGCFPPPRLGLIFPMENLQNSVAVPSVA
jgi:hypothetical protein